MRQVELGSSGVGRGWEKKTGRDAGLDEEQCLGEGTRRVGWVGAPEGCGCGGRSERTGISGELNNTHISEILI